MQRRNALEFRCDSVSRHRAGEPCLSFLQPWGETVTNSQQCRL